MAGPGTVKVYLCGRLTVELAGEHVEGRLRGRQGRQLFAHLVANRNRTLTRDELIDAVWPFEPPAHAGPALSTLLSQLRALLGPDAVQGRSEIQLVLPPDSWVDVEAASEAVGRAEAALAQRDWRSAWSPANVARAIAERGFLPGYDAPWIDVRRRGVEDLLIEALECLAKVGVQLGGSELAAAERAAYRLVELAPLRESGHVTLMAIQEARGNAPEGLRVYEDLRRLLDDELGATPGTAAQQVHLRLLGAGAPPANSGVETVSPQQVPLPALLAAPQRAGLVGRERELERLELALARSREIPSQLVLVAGEPGIGKTRLLVEFGRRAHASGAAVLYGRTDEDGLMPYGALLEALRQYVADAPASSLQRAAALGGEQLRGVLPGLPPGEGEGLDQRGNSEAMLARYRLFDALSAVLADAAAACPVVLLLDDLQWADEATLLLLKHVLRAAAQRRLLAVGSYRDSELHRAPALLDALADLQRDLRVDRVHVRGLAQIDVAQLAAHELSGDVPEWLAARVHGETDGNPFFALELLHNLSEQRGDTTSEWVPEGVRAVIMRRVGQLAEPTQRALSAAAVLGREFDRELLEAAADVSGDELDAALDEAVAARVVNEVPSRSDRYAFVHALTRTALYASLTRARQGRLHERAADALERLAASGRPVAATEIAVHALAALPRGDPLRAIESSERAAAEATDLLAFEEAAGHLARALDALARHRANDVGRRVALLLDLGHAQRRSGRMPEARATFLDARDAARELDDVELLARAVLGYGGGWFESGFLDETMVALLEEALAALGDADSLLHLELLSRLAKALYYSEDPRDEARRPELAEQATAMARRLGGAQAELIALEARHVALASPENLAERVTAAAEIIELGRAVGDHERELLGRYFLIADLIEADRLDEAADAIASYSQLAEESGLPLHRWYRARLGAMRALLEGRADDAAALVEEALSLGAPIEPRTATMHFWVQTWFLNHLRGRLAALEDAVRGLVPEYPRAPAWRLGVAYVLLDQGRREEAQEIFGTFADRSFGGIPRDANWSTTVALAAGLLAVGLGDAGDAAALYELIAPYADQNVVSAEAIVCLGPMSLYCGLAALVAGKVDAAVDDLEKAVEACVRLRTAPFEHTSVLALSGALALRGAPGDADRCEKLAARADAIGASLPGALESARQLGLEVLPDA